MGRKDVSPSGQRVPGSCGPGIPSQGQQGAGLTCRPRADMDQAATSLPQPTHSSHLTQHGSGPSTVGASSSWVLPCSPIPRPHGIPSELVVSAQALTVHLGGLEARPPEDAPPLPRQEGPESRRTVFSEDSHGAAPSSRSNGRLCQVRGPPKDARSEPGAHQGHLVGILTPRPGAERGGGAHTSCLCAGFKCVVYSLF